MQQFEIWLQTEGEPEFVGYSRATNFTEAVVLKLGKDSLDLEEDKETIVLNEAGFPSIGGFVVAPHKALVTHQSYQTEGDQNPDGGEAEQVAAVAVIENDPAGLPGFETLSVPSSEGVSPLEGLEQPDINELNKKAPEQPGDAIAPTLFPTAYDGPKQEYPIEDEFKTWQATGEKVQANPPAGDELTDAITSTGEFGVAFDIPAKVQEAEAKNTQAPVTEETKAAASKAAAPKTRKPRSKDNLD